MKIKITRATIVERQEVLPGTIMDVPKKVAVVLFSAGKAVPASPEMETAELMNVQETADLISTSKKARK